MCNTGYGIREFDLQYQITDTNQQPTAHCTATALLDHGTMEKHLLSVWICRIYPAAGKRGTKFESRSANESSKAEIESCTTIFACPSCHQFIQTLETQHSAHFSTPGKRVVIRGVYFDWDEAYGGHHDVGMIAEEIGMMLPGVVTYEPSGTDAIGIDYSKVPALLVEAIRELKLENERLKAEYERLKLPDENRQTRLEKNERIRDLDIGKGTASQ